MSRKKRPLPPPINAIVFDLGNIIVDVRYDRIMETLNLSREQFHAAYASQLFRDFEMGLFSVETFAQKFQEEMHISAEQAVQYQDNILMAFPLRLQTWGVIQLLARRYPVYLLSNTNALDFEAIDAEYGIRDHLDDVFLSYEQSALKPDVDTYRKAATRWNLIPEQTLFFDDRADNVAGAIEAGWHAVQIFSETQLLNELVERELISIKEVVY